MENRFLGNSGLQISALVLGNWLTHGDQIEDKAAEKCIRTAVENGIYTFDTADAYANGAAEKILGRVLQDYPRESLVLISKVYWPVRTFGPNDAGLSRKHILESCHNSLRRLHTDYLDVYLAHRYDYQTPLEETMCTFADLVHQGKVNYIGVSEWYPDQIHRAAQLARELRIPLITNQAQYSMLWRTIEDGIIDACEQNGMAQLCFSPLAQGVLTGKYHPGESPKGKSRAAAKTGSKFISRWMDDELLATVQGLRRVAEEAGCRMNQLALAWLLARRNVAGVVFGSSKASQIEDNLKALDVKMDESLFAAVDEVLSQFVVYHQPDDVPRSPLQRPQS